MSNNTLSQKFSRVFNLATDSKAITRPVVIVCSILSVLIHLAPSGGTVYGNIFMRILVAIIAYLPGLAIVIIFFKISERFINNKLRIALRITSYILGGAMRGLFLSVSFYWLDMADALNLMFRIPASAIPFGFAMATATYAFSATEESRARVYSLLNLEEELKEITVLSKKKEFDLRDHLLNKLKDNIKSQLIKIQSISHSVTVEELQTLSDEIVRPLSHELARRVPVWEGANKLPVKIKWRKTLTQIQPVFALKPMPVATLSNLTALTAFIYFFGLTTAIPLIICTSTLLYLSISLMRKLVIRLQNINNLIIRFIFITFLLLTASLPTGFVGDLIITDPLFNSFVLHAGLIVVPIFGWFIAIGGAAQFESDRLEYQYQQRISQLTWLRARFNLVNWYEQGKLARILHGPVQSSINKAIIKLNTQENEVNTSVIDDLRYELHKILASEAVDVELLKDFDQICQDFAFTWKELCQIDFAISPNAKTALTIDQICASITWNVIHDCCHNATKHGEAKWISVRIDDPVKDIIEIEIRDNGTEYKFKPIPGLGSNLLDACALNWNRERTGTQTVLKAQFPIQVTNL